MLVAALACSALVAWLVAAWLGDSVAPKELEGWPVVEVEVGDSRLRLVEAVDTAQGLAGVEDLGGLDGMLFTYPVAQDPAVRRFHMTGVRFPLDALFFDADGRLIEAIAMAVCAAEPCPRYAPTEPYRWVVEVPAGSVDAAPGAVLDVGASR